MWSKNNAEWVKCRATCTCIKCPTFSFSLIWLRSLCCYDIFGFVPSLGIWNMGLKACLIQNCNCNNKHDCVKFPLILRWHIKNTKYHEYCFKTILISGDLAAHHCQTTKGHVKCDLKLHTVDWIRMIRFAVNNMCLLEWSVLVLKTTGSEDIVLNIF